MHFTDRDRERMVLHLKCGDRVKWNGPATCFEMPGDQGEVIIAEQRGPWMSANYQIRWDRTREAFWYCNGHADWLTLTPSSPTA